MKNAYVPIPKIFFMKYSFCVPTIASKLLYMADNVHTFGYDCVSELKGTSRIHVVKDTVLMLISLAIDTSIYVD